MHPILIKNFPISEQTLSLEECSLHNVMTGLSVEKST